MIKPVGERILIKKLEKDTEGLELAKMRSEELVEGEVVALGKGAEKYAQKGDMVIIDKYQGQEYEEDDQLYKIVDCEYILAIK